MQPFLRRHVQRTMTSQVTPIKVLLLIIITLTINQEQGLCHHSKPKLYKPVYTRDQAIELGPTWYALKYKKFLK